MIAREHASWRVHEGGLTPPTPTNSPTATIFIVSTANKNNSDYAFRLQYAGGKYFRIDLKIEESMDNASAPWARKYLRASYIVCSMSRGDSFDSRYSQRCDPVCVGIHGLIDTPNATLELAEKIRIAMNVSMATQSMIQLH